MDALLRRGVVVTFVFATIGPGCGGDEFSESEECDPSSSQCGEAGDSSDGGADTGGASNGGNGAAGRGGASGSSGTDGAGAPSGEGGDGVGGSGAASGGVSTGGSGGASTGGSGGSSGSGGNAGCDLSSPFGAAVPVPGINGTNSFEANLRLSEDQSTAVFTSSRSMSRDGDWDLYAADRMDAAGAFGPAEQLFGLNSDFFEGHPTLSSDLLTVYFESDRESALLIYRATRDTEDDPFTDPEPVDEVNGQSNAFHPYFVGGTETLYFGSTRAGTWDIYVTELENGTFTVPSPVPGVNSTMFDEQRPVVTPDELTIYYASSEGGSPDVLHIWMARRETRSAAFSDPVDVAELHTWDDDIPSWVSPDGCVLYFEAWNDIPETVEQMMATRGR